MIEIFDIDILLNSEFKIPLNFYAPYLVFLTSALISWLGRLDYLAIEWARKHSL